MDFREVEVIEDEGVLVVAVVDVEVREACLHDNQYHIRANKD